MIKKSLTKLAIAATLATAGTAAFADCGDVQIAEMNWASAELMANVDKIILENGYGCDVELVPGATMTSFASMNEKGQPDVAPELWINAVREPLNAAMGEGRLHSTNDGPITQLGEGWWVTPAFQAAHPELDTVVKILRTSRPIPRCRRLKQRRFCWLPSGLGLPIGKRKLVQSI